METENKKKMFQKSKKEFVLHTSKSDCKGIKYKERKNSKKKLKIRRKA